MMVSQETPSGQCVGVCVGNMGCVSTHHRERQVVLYGVVRCHSDVLLHISPLCPPETRHSTCTQASFLFHLLFHSPRGIPGSTQLGNKGLPGKHHLGLVYLFPWFLRSQDKGRRQNLGTKSKSSIPFSLQYINTSSIPLGKAARDHLVVHLDSA